MRGGGGGGEKARGGRGRDDGLGPGSEERKPWSGGEASSDQRGEEEKVPIPGLLPDPKQVDGVVGGGVGRKIEGEIRGFLSKEKGGGRG